MPVKMNLKIKESNKDLICASFVYSTFLAASTQTNQSTCDLFNMFSFINKDWHNVIVNVSCSKTIVEKLLDNKKLNNSEQKLLQSYKKIINVPKIKTNKVYCDKIKEYEKTIKPNFEKILDDIFTDTKVKVNVAFLYSLLYKNTKGSSVKNGIIININNNLNDFDYSFFTKLINHETIHSVCSNNKEYNKIIQEFKDKQTRHIFNETFTSTIENISMYKLGIWKEKYKTYYFREGPYKEIGQKIEKNIRKLYDSWEKIKYKNKINFALFLGQNIKKVI